MYKSLWKCLVPEKEESKSPGLTLSVACFSFPCFTKSSSLVRCFLPLKCCTRAKNISVQRTNAIHTQVKVVTNFGDKLFCKIRAVFYISGILSTSEHFRCVEEIVALLSCIVKKYKELSKCNQMLLHGILAFLSSRPNFFKILAM